MTKPKRDRPRNLPGPNRNEVKIWFQGSTGSGKTVLARFIQDALEARGLTVRTYAFGSRDYVPEEAQIVDLTQQEHPRRSHRRVSRFLRMATLSGGGRGDCRMTMKAFCNICEREVREIAPSFLLRKHGIVVEAKVNNWGKQDRRTAAISEALGFGREANHICHSCLLDIVRTGTPDPNGWSKEEMIELKIGNVVGMK